MRLLFSIFCGNKKKKKNPTKTKHRNPVVLVCVVFHKQLFYVLQPHCLHRPNVFIFLFFPIRYCDSFKRCHGVWFKHYIMKAVVFAKKSKVFVFFLADFVKQRSQFRLKSIHLNGRASSLCLRLSSFCQRKNSSAVC